MDHTEALGIHATERYVLGELSTSEAEAFEQHYFGCAHCAADLESATALIANAQAVFRQEAAPVRRASARRSRVSAWKTFLAGLRPRFALATTALASIVLGGVCLYQTLVSIPRLKQAAFASNTAFVLPAFALAGRARGDETTISIPRDARSFSVSFDIDPQAGYPEYRCYLKDRARSVRFPLRTRAPAAGEPITVSLPARELQPGRYDLVVDGLRGTEVAAGISSFPFILEFK
jgi:anti-sigma factor RsiW